MMKKEGSPPRVLLIVNAVLDDKKIPAIAAGTYPRKDYYELREALDADIIDLGAVDKCWWTRILRRVIGASLAQVVLARTRASRYDAVFVDQETTGFAFAALLSRRRPRLVMIGHFLSPRKAQLSRALGLQRKIDCMIVHSTQQQRSAERGLGLRPAQIALVPYQTDEHFWSPRPATAKRQICAVGLENRDYDTLIAAVRNMDIQVVVAAASLWSTHDGVASAKALPRNVAVASFDYAALRNLYAESFFIVVPLKDVDNQSGITTILEAMAMGKAVVVSHTRGQTDVVRDRRHASRVAPERPTQPEWARILGAADTTVQEPTGIYVRPGDTGELRRAIAFLVDHPEIARTMGRNGRQLLLETMSLAHFAERVAALIIGRPPAPRDASTAPEATTPDVQEHADTPLRSSTY